MFKFLKRRRRIITVVVIIASLAYGGYRLFFDRQPETTGYRVTRRDISETLELSGEIDAAQKADLHFQSGGLLTYLPFKEGDRVNRYQTIASLDQRLLQSDLHKYLNLYAIERRDFDQNEVNYRSRLSSDVDNQIKRILEKAQYELDNTVIDVEIKNLSIQYSRLTAPFNGILTQVPVPSVGINISITDIFQLVNPDSLYFSANIDESDIAQTAPGLKTMITLDAFPDKTFESKIESIAFSAKETSTGTAYETKFLLPTDTLSQLRLGFNGTAEIILSEKQAVLTLPVESVSEKEDGFYVLVKENGNLVDKKIEVGSQTNEYIEILSGLDENQEVYTETK